MLMYQSAAAAALMQSIAAVMWRLFWDQRPSRGPRPFWDQRAARGLSLWMAVVADGNVLNPTDVKILNVNLNGDH